MTQFLLPLCAGMLCTLCGMRLASSLHKEEARLLRWSTLLAHCEVLLSACAYSLPEVFRLCATDENAADVLLRTLSEQMQTERMTPLVTLAEAACPPCMERECLLRWLQAVSHGELDSRLFATQSARKEIDLMYQQSHQKAEKDAKLYQTLGWVGGLCLMLLML